MRTHALNPFTGQQKYAYEKNVPCAVAASMVGRPARQWIAPNATLLSTAAALSARV